MKRKEFISSLGKGAALAITLGCFGGCAQENIQPDFLSNVDFEIDLEDPQFASLKTTGGFVVINSQVVVARTLADDYVAATRVCSHEPRRAIRFRNEEWYCPEHGARFSLSGQGLNNRGRSGLKIYQTSLNGNMLSVFS